MEQMVFVGFKIPEELRDRTRAAAEQMHESEGQFIRAAIVEKLERMGVTLGRDLVRAPSRRGVGGYPTHKARQSESNPMLNDAPSSAVEADMAAAAALVPATVSYRRPPSRGAGRKAASPTGSVPAPEQRPRPAKARQSKPATPVPNGRENPT